MKKTAALNSRLNYFCSCQHQTTGQGSCQGGNQLVVVLRDISGTKWFSSIPYRIVRFIRQCINIQCLDGGGLTFPTTSPLILKLSDSFFFSLLHLQSVDLTEQSLSFLLLYSQPFSMFCVTNSSQHLHLLVLCIFQTRVSCSSAL